MRKTGVILETERLILRPWKRNKADAKALYQCAKDPKIGPSAGWPVHRDVANSMEIIRNVLCTDGIFAVVGKEQGHPIGAAGLTYDGTARKEIPAGEAELGYWLGRDYWGQGLIPEAAGRLLQYAFEELHKEAVWGAYFDGNIQSARVMEKLGFTWQRQQISDVALLGEQRLEHFTRLTRQEWEKQEKTIYKS